MIGLCIFQPNPFTHFILAPASMSVRLLLVGQKTWHNVGTETSHFSSHIRPQKWPPFPQNSSQHDAHGSHPKWSLLTDQRESTTRLMWSNALILPRSKNLKQLLSWRWKPWWNLRSLDSGAIFKSQPTPLGREEMKTWSRIRLIFGKSSQTPAGPEPSLLFLNTLCNFSSPNTALAFFRPDCLPSLSGQWQQSGPAPRPAPRPTAVLGSVLTARGA